MGTAERRERERQELREKILDAARELFTKFGYEAVSMRKIAEKIEYSPTTIYLHFADKESLVRELCSQDFLALASCFRALAAEPDPIERLRGIGQAYVRFARERPNHYRMMFMTQHPPVSVVERSIEKGNVQVDAWALLKNTVEEAQRAGLIRDDMGGPEVVAELLMAGVHGVASLHVAKGNDPWIDWSPVQQLADRMIDALLRGCAPSQARPRTARRTRARRR
jgi:AcrR family transcriptional regulator